MWCLNNQFFVITTLVICCCDVLLSAPQYSFQGNNYQQLPDNERDVTETIQDQIVPVSSPELARNTSSFVPLSPLIYSPPMHPYNPLLFQPYMMPPSILPNIQPSPFLSPIQPFQPPLEAQNFYLDYDENNNLIANSTTGFQPINDDVIESSGSRFRTTTNNQTYTTPIKSIKKQEYRTTNQESYIVAETYIRPNEKPKTIIKVYYDPSQNRDNITIVDPEPNKVIEVQSNVVNEHVISNRGKETVDNPTDKSEGILGSQGAAPTFPIWPFAPITQNEVPTRPPETTTEEEMIPEAPTTEEAEETTLEETTPEETVNNSDDSYEDVRRQNSNGVSDEDDEDNDEEVDAEDQRDDYNAIIPQPSIKKKINNKVFERIPTKWRNTPTTEQVVQTTTTQIVPIWLRKSNTTPKIFAFNNMRVPSTAGGIMGNTTPKSNNQNNGWFSWNASPYNYNPKTWNVETTTKGLRFAFFR